MTFRVRAVWSHPRILLVIAVASRQWSAGWVSELVSRVCLQALSLLPREVSRFERTFRVYLIREGRMVTILVALPQLPCLKCSPIVESHATQRSPVNLVLVISALNPKP